VVDQVPEAVVIVLIKLLHLEVGMVLGDEEDMIDVQEVDMVVEEEPTMTERVIKDLSLPQTVVGIM
jgi:hypothetical protein